MDKSFSLFGKQFPLRHMNKHLVFCGQTGSGKTVGVRLTLQSVLPRIGTSALEGGMRAVIGDVKNEARPQLAGMGLRCQSIFTNPYDSLGAAWALGEDVTGPATALEVASILIPEENESAQPFFGNAARHLLFGILLAFITICPGRFTLRQICLAMRSHHYMRQILSLCPQTRHLVNLYLKEEGKLLQSILSTIATKMMAYEVVAALWDRAEKEGRTFSLQDFVRKEQILVIGNHERVRTATDAINRSLIKLLSLLLLSQNDGKERLTFLALDELREMGGGAKLDGLDSLLLRGRSFGVACLLAFQSKDGLNAVYSEEIADELLDQCGFKVFLKCDGNTAKWAADQFGEQEALELRNNQSYSYGGEHTTLSQGRSEELRKRETLMAGELLSLAPASARNGLHTYVKTPWGSYKTHCHFAPLLCAEDRNTPNFVPRSESDEYLEDWTDEELTQFGLTRVPDDPTSINWKSIRQNLFPRDKRKRNQASGIEDEDDD